MANAFTVMDLCNPTHKEIYTSTPREAVIAAYARSLHDGNSWQWEERYGHLVVEGKHTTACGDFSAFKNRRLF